MARRFAAGKATKEELRTAWEEACMVASCVVGFAPTCAADAAACVASIYCSNAHDIANNAAYAVTHADSAAASDRVKERKWQKEELLKLLTKWENEDGK